MSYRFYSSIEGQQKSLGQNWAGQAAGKKGGPPSVKVAHVYVVLRYLNNIKTKHYAATSVELKM